MQRFLVASLLLTACSGSELSPGGASVVVAEVETPACRSLGTVREAEGGGLSSFSSNRDLAEVRLRNAAARLGGNALMVLSEERGDTDSGALHFTTGVAGLSAPNPRCTNCVMMTARVYTCEGQAPRTPVAAAPPEAPPAAPPPAAPPPMAPPPWQPAWGAPPPAAPPIIIIIQPALPPQQQQR